MQYLRILAFLIGLSVAGMASAAYTIKFNGDQEGNGYSEGPVRVAVTSFYGGQFFFGGGLHVDGPNVSSPGSYKIYVPGKSIGFLRVTSVCCPPPEDPADGIGIGALTYYDFEGQPLASVSIGGSATPEIIDLRWTGGAYAIFSGNHASITNLIVTGVPEPSSWAMLILGFVVCGTTLRSPRGRRISSFRAATPAR